MNRIASILARFSFCSVLFFFSSLTAVVAAPIDHQTFKEFLDSFYLEAASAGITRETYDRAFASVTEPDAKVLKSAAYQAEFTTKIWDYLDARVNPLSIIDGRIMAGVYSKTLSEVEKEFGVEASVILAIWSMETSYGAALRRTSRLYYVPRALATIAYADKRRQKFGRSQLLATLQIVQAGDVGLDQLMGSWAGAMGHTQFIPTSFLAYGVDFDGDGRRDIWNSIPDALATAANLLRQNKWRTGKPWGYEVKVPAGGALFKGKTKTVVEWQKLGFIRPGGLAFEHAGDDAELKLIGGDAGPGFLMLKNFFVLKRYNNSDFYALAVGLLANKLAGKKGMVQSWPRPAGALSAGQKFELQELLAEKGFYTGGIDGRIGSNTKKGIKAFQLKNGLVVDGEPTLDLLHALQK
jgi:membrane-bound lytic murein transglycosylase B